jgi:hypothetical protein
MGNAAGWLYTPAGVSEHSPAPGLMTPELLDFTMQRFRLARRDRLPAAVSAEATRARVDQC